MLEEQQLFLRRHESREEEAETGQSTINQNCQFWIKKIGTRRINGSDQGQLLLPGLDPTQLTIHFSFPYIRYKTHAQSLLKRFVVWHGAICVLGYDS